MNSRPLLFTLSVSTFLTAAFAGIQQPAKPKKPTVDYNRDIRPLLAQHCWPCHGQDKDALARTGGLRLDTFEGATANRGGLHAIVPGKPANSAMIERITAPD